MCFSDVIILNMIFSKDNLAIIQFFRVEKHYGARRIIAECPIKCWARSGIKKLLRKIDKMGSTQRQQGSGRPRSVRCLETIDNVENLILSQENNLQSHSTQRKFHETCTFLYQHKCQRRFALKVFKKVQSNQTHYGKQGSLLEALKTITLLVSSVLFSSLTKNCLQ